MSVTNLNEIEKADVLVAGLRKHLKEAQEIGITNDAINRLEEAAKDLRQRDAEVDNLRRQATLKAHENLELIADLKAQMLSMRTAEKAAIRSTSGSSTAYRIRDNVLNTEEARSRPCFSVFRNSLIFDATRTNTLTHFQYRLALRTAGGYFL